MNRFRSAFFMDLSKKGGIVSDNLSSDRASEEKFLLVNACGIDEMNSLGADIHRYRPDGRTDYQMLYIKEGQAQFLIDGEYQILKKNTVVILSPGVCQDYTYFSAVPTTTCWIHFTGSDVQRLLRENNIKSVAIELDSEFNDFYSVCKKIIGHLQLKMPMYEDICAQYLNLLIILLSQNIAMQKSNYNTQSNMKIKKVMEYMAVNYQENLQLKDYAAKCGLETNYFIQAFKKLNKVTPQVYITRLRISKAAEFLTETNMSVSEISRTVGYDDPYYFSRVFKKEMGVSPKNYCK